MMVIKKMDVFVNIPGQPEPKPKKKKKPRVQDFVIHADEYCSVQEHVIINFINFYFPNVHNKYVHSKSTEKYSGADISNI